MCFKHSFVLLLLYFMGPVLYSQHISITPSISFGVKGSSANLGIELSGLLYFDESRIALQSGYRLQHFGNAPTTQEIKNISTTSSIIFIQGIYFLSKMNVRPYVGSGVSYYLSSDVSMHGNASFIDGKKLQNYDFGNRIGFDFLLGMYTSLDNIFSLKLEVMYTVYKTKLTADLHNLYINEPDEKYTSNADFNSLNYIIGLNINL